MKKQAKKLMLNRETLSALDGEGLGEVKGGILTPRCPTRVDSCDGGQCSDSLCNTRCC